MPADAVRVGGLACQTPRPQGRAGTARGTERVISPAHHIGAVRGRAPFEGVARDEKRLELRGRLSPRGNCLLEMQLFDDQPDLLLAQSGKDCYKTSDKGRYCHRICNMPAATLSQREQLKALVSGKPIIRAQELRNAGIAGSTIQRALDDRSEAHTSELQSLMRISYAVF